MLKFYLHDRNINQYVSEAVEQFIEQQITVFTIAT